MIKTMRNAMAASAGIALAALLAPLPARAADPVTLTLKDHHFTPDRLTLPAGERVRLEVVNADATPAEFESSDLRVEKIVTAGGRITVWVGPLKPGAYKFFDDYHPDTATGTVTVGKG